MERETANAVIHPLSPIFFLPSLLLALLALPATAQPVTQPAGRLGVHEAIEVAERQSPAIHQLRARLRMKEGEWWGGFGIAAPELTYLREGIPTEGGPAFAEQRWGLSQSVDFPLTSYYRLRRTTTETDALALALQAEQANVKAAVKRAYTDLLYAQELVHLRTEEVELGRQLLAAATLRAEVGEASELDRMKAEIGLAGAESNLEEAQRQFQNARYALFHAAGLDPEAQRYDVVFPDTFVYLDRAIDQARVMARIDARPELRSAVRAVDAARLGVRHARSTLLPALQLDVYPQDLGTGYRHYGFQIGLKLPLWVVPNFRGQLLGARAEVQAQTWAEAGVRLDLKRQAEEAWHGYETSRRTIERYRTTVRSRIDELLRLTLEGYRIGEIDLLALLDAERTYLSGQLRYYDALRDYYHHLIDLERFLGEDIVFASSPEQTARAR